MNQSESKVVTPLGIGVTAILFEIVIAFLTRRFIVTHWADPIAANYAAFWATFLGLVANTLLVLVTWTSVRDNHKLVKINAEQFDKTQRVFAEFGIQLVPRGQAVHGITRLYPFVKLWIANLGVTNFFAKDIVFRLMGDVWESSPDDWMTLSVNRVIPMGSPATELDFPDIYRKRGPERIVDVQLRLRVVLLGEEKWAGAV